MKRDTQWFALPLTWSLILAGGLLLVLAGLLLLLALSFWRPDSQSHASMPICGTCEALGARGTMKLGPFSFWTISPFFWTISAFAGVQLWTFYCVFNASGLPALAVELSS